MGTTLENIVKGGALCHEDPVQTSVHKHMNARFGPHSLVLSAEAKVKDHTRGNDITFIKSC